MVSPYTPAINYTPVQPKLEEDGRIYEYTSSANPEMLPIPHLALPASHHQTGTCEIEARRGFI